MSYSVSITYTPANDLLNAKKQPLGVVSAFPIPGLSGRTAVSDEYMYAPATATKAVYNRDNFSAIDSNGNIKSTGTDYADIAYIPGGQLRWNREVTDAIYKIIEAYATPTVPVSRAWQKFTFAITGGTTTFVVENYAEAESYKNAGKALANYGISVTVSTVSA